MCCYHKGRPLRPVCRWLVLVAASAAVASPVALASGTRNVTPPPEMSHGVTVPADFVLTPAGYFHPSCIIQVDNDEAVRDDNTIEHRITGATREIPQCEHQHYRKDGTLELVPIAPALPTEPTVNGWMGAMNGMFEPIQNMYANWFVPPNPAQGGATVFFFPGLESLEDSSFILQPVLQWNQGGQGVDNQWSIASYNCCKNNNLLHSTPIAVSSGQSIYSWISGNSPNGTGVCSGWSIGTGVGSAVTTLNTSSFGQPADWAFAGVLEAYRLNSCAQLPPSGAITFDYISLETAISNIWLYPTWNVDTYSAGQQCQTSMAQVPTSAGTAVRLNWWASNYAAPGAPSSCGALLAGQGLRPGQMWSSCDGRFLLDMQTDGNLVWYMTTPTPWKVLWSSGSYHKGNGYQADFAIMQGDGNFVVYAPTGPVWATGTYSGGRLALQNDGNLVVYNSSGRAVWASNTCCR